MVAVEPKVISSEGFGSFAEYYQNGQLAHAPQEHRRGGSFKVGMFIVEQDPAEFTDPALDEIAITGVLSGDCRSAVDFGNGWTDTFIAMVDHVGLQPAHQDCSFRLTNPHKLIVASAKSQTVMEQYDRAGIRHDPFEPLYGNFAHSPKPMHLLKEMWNAMELGGPANNLLVDGLFTTLLSYMLNVDDHCAFLSTPHIDNHQLAKVIDYIEAHFDTPLLTSELAAIAAMSVAQFGRSFKAATGYSPHNYVTIRRIEHAKRMLRLGELTITQIAYCCGFSSAAHFATVFGRYVGATPSAYRAAVQ